MELRVLAPDAATGQNQHCWECRRRRLVCDATRPVCKKCQDSKIVCPGYDEKQPLRWLKPGRVTCRTRKSKAGGGGSRKDAAESGEGSGTATKYGELIHEEVKLITNFEMVTNTEIVVQAAYYCKPSLIFSRKGVLVPID